MTYDVLNKATKTQIIEWMREYILLPNISDEEFLRQINIRSLLDEEAKLIAAHADATKRLAVEENPAKMMEEIEELQKLNKQIERINKRIAAVMDVPG